MSKQVVPPDGWRYLQGDTWIFGHTFENLVSIVKTHRISNNIPIEKVENDVMEQLMKLNPSIAMNG